MELNINFDLESGLLLVAGMINLLFGVLLFVKQKRNQSDIFFSLIAVSVSLWAFARTFFEITRVESYISLWATIMYVTASFIPVFFIFFAMSFHQKEGERLSAGKILAVLLGTLFATVITILPNYVIKDIIQIGDNRVIIFGQGYIYYAIYIVLYFLTGFAVLFKKFVNSSGVVRTQIVYIFLGTSVASAIGVTTNLVLPSFGYFDLFWLGPVSTIIMVIFIAYAIIKHHLFKLRIITAELLTFVLWIFISIRILLSESLQDKLIDGVLLFIAIVFGILLIRSSIKEVRAREEIQGLADGLQKANERLRELDQQKSEFVSIASHQLRSPLTAIKGYASMLLDGSFSKIPKLNEEPVKKIYQSSKNLVNIVEDFLNVTRIEQGRMKYDFEPIDMEALLIEAVGELKPSTDEAGLDLSIKTDGSKDYVARADKGKIRQVMLNLIDNATKYTPEGSIKIKLSKSGTGKKIIVAISDTGIGISAELLRQGMFEKFNRGENSTQMHANGSGIGLYIAREIVKAHKGRIWGESKGENKGSTFSFEVPAM